MLISLYVLIYIYFYFVCCRLSIVTVLFISSIEEHSLQIVLYFKLQSYAYFWNNGNILRKYFLL